MADHLQTPERAARLMARAWHLSEDERRTQDRIRRMVNSRNLGELFERYLPEEKARKVSGPAGPDEDLFRRFMESRA